MNFQFYIEKLRDSDRFKSFIKENPDAFLCSGFFVVDREKNQNQIHLDYSSNESEEVFSFQMNKEIEMNALDKFGDKKVSKLSEDIDIDFSEVESLIEKEMKKQGVENKIQRIMVSIQEKEGKANLFATIFISMLGLVKMNILMPEKKIEGFEKKSLFDIVKVTSGKQ